MPIAVSSRSYLSKHYERATIIKLKGQLNHHDKIDLSRDLQSNTSPQHLVILDLHKFNRPKAQDLRSLAAAVAGQRLGGQVGRVIVLGPKKLQEVLKTAGLDWSVCMSVDDALKEARC